MQTKTSTLILGIHGGEPCLARCASLFDVVPATTSASGGRPHTTKCSKKRGGSVSPVFSASFPDVPASPLSRFSAECCCFCCCCCFIHSRFSLHSNSIALSTDVKLTFFSRSATPAKASVALTGADARLFLVVPGGMSCKFASSSLCFSSPSAELLLRSCCRRPWPPSCVSLAPPSKRERS